MRAVLVPDSQTFAARVMPFLTEQPIEGNVIASTLAAVLAGSRRHDDALWIVVEVVDGSLAGAAMHVPPHPVGLPGLSAPAAVAVCELVWRLRPGVAGVSGPVLPASAFAQRWAELTGVKPRLGHDMRMYRLDTLVPPSGVPGQARPATASDRALVHAWMLGFCADSGVSSEGALAAVDARLDAGWIHLWESGGSPVSLAGHAAPAEGVARIGPVYTPRQLRGRGYGAAVTAEASRRALADGARLCMLFTDLANPTSNAIYQRLGYRPVGDAREYVFRPG